MSVQKIATRYAKSLIDLSKANSKLDLIMKDMHDFLDTLARNPQIEVMLKSPVVANGHKTAVLRKIFEKNYQPETIGFFDIIVRKNRAYFLKASASAFIDQYHELNNIMKASVKTAYPLDEKTSNEINSFIEKYTGKKVLLDKVVDPELIGGLVIQMGDRLFDASISGKLSKVKQELLNTYISK